MISDILTFGKITTLALADAVNPCEMAVLIMVLVSILIQNPKNRKRVLYAGLAFSSAIFIGYLFYGIVIIYLLEEFSVLLKSYSLYFYDGLAILALILGALNIKDYFYYQPGGIATEIPMRIRPKVKLMINKITSPAGAFVIGFLVTVFLIPCTMGPYLIASGLLFPLGIIKSIPWLLYYNLLFILPMIAITLLVVLGFKEVDEISGWKEKNIKKLHLIAGILLFAIGILMLFRLL
jgi:cytochrome c biogenesis protein CcdA